jgi:hypothetical protein
MPAKQTKIDEGVTDSIYYGMKHAVALAAQRRDEEGYEKVREVMAYIVDHLEMKGYVTPEIPQILIKSPINDLVAALRSDRGYWVTWVDNIAMAFKDEFNRRTGTAIDSQLLNTIADEAARNFLSTLCMKVGNTDQREE